MADVQENGHGELGLSDFNLGSKNKYKRMVSVLTDYDGDDDPSHHHYQMGRRRKSTRKYVFGCAVFASLNKSSLAMLISLFPMRRGSIGNSLSALSGRDVGVMSGSILFSLCFTCDYCWWNFLNSVISALSVAFVYKHVPETKGKSLEQIEMLFQDEYVLQGGEVQLGDVEHLVQK